MWEGGGCCRGLVRYPAKTKIRGCPGQLRGGRCDQGGRAGRRGIEAKVVVQNTPRTGQWCGVRLATQRAWRGTGRDTQTLGHDGAEDGDREALAGRVEPGALGHPAAQRRWQVRACSLGRRRRPSTHSRVTPEQLRARRQPSPRLRRRCGVGRASPANC